MKNVESLGALWMDKMKETNSEFLHNLESVNASLTNQHPFTYGWSAGQDLSETCTAAAFPGMGEITRLEILVFIEVHTRRHIRQLQRITAKIANPSMEF